MSKSEKTKKATAATPTNGGATCAPPEERAPSGHDDQQQIYNVIYNEGYVQGVADATFEPASIRLPPPRKSYWRSYGLWLAAIGCGIYLVDAILNDD